METQQQFLEETASTIHPAKGEEKLEDVLKLLNQGERTFAIRCYRTPYKVSLRDTVERIEGLERK